ncbi:Enamine/imine deaminase [Serratia liquefaciens]|nr:Enamine/imine deaminase [Serratia liquefaciens]
METKRMIITRQNPQSRLSASVSYGDFIFLSGQTPITASADITQQSQEVLAKIDRLLAEAGSDNGHLLSAQIWLKDIANDFAAFNAVWEAWLPQGQSPTRATVQAALARPELLVEVMVTAVKVCK